MARIRTCIAIVLTVMTVSTMGVCLNDTTTTMANEFLINKWKMYFKSADVNHDGKLSKEDVQECVNNLSVMEHLDAEKGKMIKEVFEKHWDECICRGIKGDILEQEYVDSFRSDFNADKEKFKKEVDICFDTGTSAADINGDKFISKDELLIGMAAWGHQHIANDTDYFLAYNPINGLVPYRVIVDSWVDFNTSTDDSKGNIVLIWLMVDGVE